MVTPTATCLIREQPHYRRDTFHEALTLLGYKVDLHPPRRIRRDDILVLWNRYGIHDEQAKSYERVGAPVIVVENGYVPMRGTKKAFALALNHHNGAGSWVSDGNARGHLLDVELKPWHSPNGGDTLILPQRGIGPPGVAMPRGWLADVQRRLSAMRRRRVTVRLHPGTDKHDKILPIEDVLDGVACCVTWGSGAALKAIFAGVPVFHELAPWIGAPCAQFGIERIEQPYFGDREQLLERVACAQWTVEEVATAEPLARLIEHHRSKNIGGEVETRTA